jgi:hypothetical protein
LSRDVAIVMVREEGLSLQRRAQSAGVQVFSGQDYTTADAFLGSCR